MTDYDETSEQFSKSIEQLNQAINTTVQKLSEALLLIVNAVAKVLKEVFDKMKPLLDYLVFNFYKYCKNYKNRRVVHLAHYAKKHRVREKNLNRLFNDYVNEVGFYGSKVCD